MCFVCVYGPHMGRMEAETYEFGDALERMTGLVELEEMLFIAGYFIAHVENQVKRRVLAYMEGERGIERVELSWS